MKIYVVTSTELGWDCVVGAWLKATVPYETLEKQYPSDYGFVLSEITLETSIELE